MTLNELDKEFKKACRISFSVNYPLINVHFKSEIQAEVFYAEMGIYFDNQRLGAILDIRKGFDFSIFSIDTAENIQNENLDYKEGDGLEQFINSPFIKENVFFGAGFIHDPSEAAISLFSVQFETALLLERLATIQT